MTFWTLIRRSLRFHARAHLGVTLGAAVGSAALIGALILGDSVRGSLTDRALARLGGVYFTLGSPDRLFETSLRERLCSPAKSLPPPASPSEPGDIYPSSACPLAVALTLPGIVARQDGSGRANSVNVIGAETNAWPRLAGWDTAPANGWIPDWNAGKTAVLNETLARQLAVQPGDELIVRVRQPSAMGMDAAVQPRDQPAVAMRLKVGAILSARMLGDFSTVSRQLPPANLFLPLDSLQRQAAVPGRANLMLFGPALSKAKLNGWEAWRAGAKTEAPVRAELAVPWLDARVQDAWRLEDVALSVRAVEQPPEATGGEYVRPFIEVANSRIFLEPPVAAAALRPRTTLLTNHEGFQADTPRDVSFCQFVTNGTRVLTYLGNLMRVGDRATPYSMVTAAEGPMVPAGMRDDEILLNEWLAEDLKAGPGDSVELSYFVADSGARLSERTNAFRVRAVVPLKGIYADRTLMPQFPGLAKAESTHDWDAGFPLVYHIREKDEAYWRQYRGTPKAFVTLAAGQRLWANRFGALTAIRYEVPTNFPASAYRDAACRNLLANLHPAELGLHIEPVRAQALRAAEQGQDFGQLFLGFSIFLVVAALLLMALLFQFGLEQRAAEIGALLALGFRTKQVRRLLLAEGAGLAWLGGVAGTLGAVGYAKLMLKGLNTIWRGAVGDSLLTFHASPATLAIGLCAGVLVALATIWLTLRRQARRPAWELLSGEVAAPEPRARSRGAWVAFASGLGALAILGWAVAKGDTANAEAFFGGGTLLLVAGLALTAAWLGLLARGASARQLTLGALAVRGCARRRNRSLATVALLACGWFVIAAIGVFRLDANQNATSRSSGTGGFALLGSSSLPIAQDLNTKAAREFFGLSAEDLAGVAFVPFRVHEGDDASCLNLSRAQQPRLLGVNPALLEGRFTFAQTAKGSDRRRGWQLLSRSQGAGAAAAEEIPAIGDANSIEWALGKKLGDTLDYTDERGRTFKVCLVGAAANSILQGNLIIDEAEFVKRFPNESGYRMFLIDAPSNAVARVSATLSRALQDAGLELTPAAQRLDAFNAVQNTYLGTFQVLGGLGLLLGSAGLGIVVLRNVLERRGELGLFIALGFRRRTLQRWVVSEHGALLAIGLSIGSLAAVVAVLPFALSPGSRLPWLSLGLTLGAVLLNGALWTWLATRYALRGNLLEALRNE